MAQVKDDNIIHKKDKKWFQVYQTGNSYFYLPVFFKSWFLLSLFITFSELWYITWYFRQSIELSLHFFAFYLSSYLSLCLFIYLPQIFSHWSIYVYNHYCFLSIFLLISLSVNLSTSIFSHQSIYIYNYILSTYRSTYECFDLFFCLKINHFFFVHLTIYLYTA